TGVKTFDDVLNAQITKVSSKAREFGVTEGMTGKEALNLLS
ncbi:MAG: YunC family protein, partial [Candidatus Altiarchaeota archaeon]|nr:YunC family protein [Candidatus Altiarchaeota archaeon]